MTRQLVRDRTIDMLAQLMWGPKTLDEIAAGAGVNIETARRFISSMRAAGCVYIRERISTGRRGGPRKLWALQPKPFEHPDAPTIRQSRAKPGPRPVRRSPRPVGPEELARLTALSSPWRMADAA